MKRYSPIVALSFATLVFIGMAISSFSADYNDATAVPTTTPTLFATPSPTLAPTTKSLITRSPTFPAPSSSPSMSSPPPSETSPFPSASTPLPTETPVPLGRDQNSTSQSDELHQWCTPQEVQNGKWVRVERDQAPYDTPDDFQKSSLCYNVSKVSTITPWVTYDWVPSSNCSFRAFDADLFCNTFSNQTVSFIGDSLSFEMYAALIYSLGGNVVERDSLRSGRFKLDHVITDGICNNSKTSSNGLRLTYRRDDSLENLPVLFQIQQPDLLILNRGAHFVHNFKLRRQIVQTIAQVQAYQQDCRNQSRVCKIIVRKTIPGHPLCWNYHQPSDSLEDMWSIINNRSLYTWSREAPHFHWWDFQSQNELVVNLFNQSLPRVEFDVLDAVNPLVLRPDLHRWAHGKKDCLHSCYPGRMDFLNQLFLHQSTTV